MKFKFALLSTSLLLLGAVGGAALFTNNIESIETSAQDIPEPVGAGYRIYANMHWDTVKPSGSYVAKISVYNDDNQVIYYNEVTEIANVTDLQINKWTTVCNFESMTVPKSIKVEFDASKISKVSRLIFLYYNAYLFYNDSTSKQAVSLSTVDSYTVGHNTSGGVWGDGTYTHEFKKPSGCDITFDNSNCSSSDVLMDHYVAPSNLLNNCKLADYAGKTFLNENGENITYTQIPSPNEELTGTSFAGYYDEEYTLYYDNYGIAEDINIKKETANLKAMFTNAVTLKGIDDAQLSYDNPKTGMIISNNKYFVTEETLLPSASKVGYKFNGWKDENGNYVDRITSDSVDARTFTADFEILKFNVSFDTDGGTTIQPLIVEYGQKVSKPLITPEKQSTNLSVYTFAGWYTSNTFANEFDFDNTIIYENTTIYAKYNINEEINIFVNSYMHPEIPADDPGTGLCYGSTGYYSAAKVAFNDLSDDSKNVFWINNDYLPYKNRLIAWANANKDTISQFGIIDSASKYETVDLNKRVNSVIACIAAGSTILVGGAIAFALAKKKKKI